jgi:hypothetical protein
MYFTEKNGSLCRYIFPIMNTKFSGTLCFLNIISLFTNGERKQETKPYFYLALEIKRTGITCGNSVLLMDVERMG